MSVALTKSIAVPLPKKSLRLTFTASSGNFVRVWCTAAPPGSRLRTNLDKDKSERVHVIDADSGRDVEYTFEAAGAYQLQADEYRKGAAPYGGGYQSAPDAAPAEVLLGSTALTLYVANQLKSAIGFGPDTAELVLHVLSDRIAATSVSAHGILTPAIQKPKSAKATTAAANSALSVTLAALGGQDAEAMLGDLSALATLAIDKCNAHFASGTFHATADTDNAIASDYRAPSGPEALRRTVGALLKALGAHIRNDSVTDPQGTGSTQWHKISGQGRVDWPALPLFESTSTIADHLRGLADFCRSFEAHRESEVHADPDMVNGIGTLPRLIDVHAQFLAQIASLNPVTPITDNAAKTTLVHGAGFEEN